MFNDLISHACINFIHKLYMTISIYIYKIDIITLCLYAQQDHAFGRVSLCVIYVAKKLAVWGLTA